MHGKKFGLVRMKNGAFEAKGNKLANVTSRHITHDSPQGAMVTSHHITHDSQQGAMVTSCHSFTSRHDDSFCKRMQLFGF